MADDDTPLPGLRGEVARIISGTDEPGYVFASDTAREYWERRAVAAIAHVSRFHATAARSLKDGGGGEWDSALEAVAEEICP
jgi:hypothetical protein